MACTYAFELSGEHNTLPRSEALALLDVYSSGYKEMHSFDQCLIVEAKDLDACTIGFRLAMTHRIIEVLAICNASLDALADATNNIRIPGKSYRIRARRVKDAALQGDWVEKEVGRALHKQGYDANLSNPEVELRAIITGDKIVLGIEVARTDRSGFEHRRPHLKAFFYPGVLMPRIGRALVNIAQARVGELLLDSFSGTGGILVEACLIGMKGIGVDVQNKLVRGGKVNLEGLDCTLILGDAKRLPLKDGCVDSAVLDTPYGRSALIEAESKNRLLEESLAEIHRVLKLGRRMVIVTDRQIKKQLNEVGFLVIENHMDRVHRSLTRYISVCAKPSEVVDN
jgi:tRNA (guanine10-N2)-dimethyltransferase